MSMLLEIFVYIAMAAVVIVLFLGLGSFYTGDGKTNRSNILMRWRIGLQLVAVGLLAILVFLVDK
ncbi:MAG: hypothetical protein CMM30_08495 [Rhodospirillaceae bacterium]|nr:hypothetical protein [Alphaproteobacteria bacterium]MBR72962.1 hypothetical protein [Rhodospirillaceae bacterium]